MSRARDLADSADKDVTGTLTTDGLTVAGNVSVDGGTIKLDGNYPTGTSNVAIGDAALDDGSLSGGYNTAAGAGALSANTSGAQNTAVGAFSSDANTTGSYNSSFGQSSLGSNTTGDNNTGLGRGALSANTTAANNTAAGYNALAANTTAAQNTAVGSQALLTCSTGHSNTAVGMNALKVSTTASNNTAVGYAALVNSTTGDLHTAIGSQALVNNTTGSKSVAVGINALFSQTTGARNVSVGRDSGYALTTATNNTFLGENAGSTITTGSKNTVIGRYNGNQNGLDIRTSDNNVVLSNGDGDIVALFDSGGVFDMSYIDSAGMFLSNAESGGDIALFRSEHTGFSGQIQVWRALRSSNTNWHFLKCQSNDSSDNEFRLRGDGNAFADGSWSGGGADYAEYFEWSDGNTSDEDRRGYSVVMVDEKIRRATSSDAASDIIGVVSARPAVVGDDDSDRWKSKYLRDDYGAYVLDANGDRTLNPDYDSSLTYQSREDRQEWDTIGLMGKLRLRAGQPTGNRWIKMRDVATDSDGNVTVEEWLIR